MMMMMMMMMVAMYYYNYTYGLLSQYGLMIYFSYYHYSYNMVIIGLMIYYNCSELPWRIIANSCSMDP